MKLATAEQRKQKIIEEKIAKATFHANPREKKGHRVTRREAY